MTELSKEEREVLVWTERNLENEASKKRQNRAAVKAFLIGVVAIALALAVGTYLAELRLRGII